MGMAIILSVVFIYLLMGFLFESFILPLSILFTIPLSAIGVWWIHFLMGYNIDFLGVVAIVLLVGVVVNNGIVLIDYVNRLRNQGDAREEALLTATGRRFRPIMMITTIGGMIPLAFAGANSIGLSYTSFALTLIGGMTTATLLTLLVVPVFYTFFDDLRDVFFLTLRRRRGEANTARGRADPAILTAARGGRVRRQPFLGSVPGAVDRRGERRACRLFRGLSDPGRPLLDLVDAHDRVHGRNAPHVRRILQLRVHHDLIFLLAEQQLLDLHEAEQRALRDGLGEDLVDLALVEEDHLVDSFAGRFLRGHAARSIAPRKDVCRDAPTRRPCRPLSRVRATP